ncbi:PepSY domain-containing protein [Marilutibacter maris]|uniref:Uncharacterized protein n=1 Tax=Marilutibacter maris TaxID=1605891 RepID=A0A2U9T750_9GAMM|nr:PepSY domain-containing protein [Lysobacter maris]AWV06328.1 hypothetical protein C9I47_0605 [Lysobacter maris]KAB8198663.1 hypothetical protein FKV24_000370 [Lysobacter maris]
MPRSLARSTVLILLAASAVVGGEVAAQQLGRGPAPTDRRESRPAEPARHSRGADHRALSDAVRRVERRTGGQVLSAERVPFDGRDVNRIKVVDSSGRVRVYMDDPHSSRAPRPMPERLDARRTRDDDD